MAGKGWTWTSQRCDRYKYQKLLIHTTNPDNLVPSAARGSSGVLAIAAAPTALADSAMSCNSTDAGNECQMPGNVQIDDAPPPVSYSPYGGLGLALGVGDGGFHGGGHR